MKMALCKACQKLSLVKLHKCRPSFSTPGFPLPLQKDLGLGDSMWHMSLTLVDEYVKGLCASPDEKRKRAFVPRHLVGEAGDSTDYCS